MPLPISYLVLFLALSTNQVLAKGSNNAKHVSDPITQTCTKTLYKDLCISTLKTFPQSGSADLKELARMALKATSLKGGDVHKQITLLDKETFDEMLKQSLRDCSENYQDAIDQLEDSLAALENKAYQDVITWLSAAMTDTESCADSLSENDSSSALSDSNTEFKNLCSIVLAIINQLAKS